MALDFGKLNFSVSFNPTSAFPLDARCYFESYSEALQAAKSADYVGSTNSVYYFGQTLIVVEDQKAKFYIIQPDKTLAEIAHVSDGINIDTNQFEYDSNGNLSLKGFDTAALSSVLSVGPGGTLVWSEVYSKAETDAQIAAAVSAAARLKRKIVSSLEEIDIYAVDADQYIYMVPDATASEGANEYQEYMVLILTQGDEEIRLLEQVGSWSVDLSDYATNAALETLLNAKVDKVPGSRLMTEAEGKKLADLQPPLISSVNNKQFSVTDGKLQLIEVAVTEVKDLSDILNQGVETAGGYSLLSREDKEKLDKIEISPVSGSLEIQSSQVVDLSSWITKHSTGDNAVPGLSKHNLTDERLAKLDKAITTEFIKSVEPEFTVKEGHLSLNKISIQHVADLSEALERKADMDQLILLSNTVAGHETNLQDLRKRLTWEKI